MTTRRNDETGKAPARKAAKRARRNSDATGGVAAEQPALAAAEAPTRGAARTAVKRSAKKTAAKAANEAKTAPKAASARRTAKPSAVDGAVEAPPAGLEGRIGYRFRDGALLELALTHSSFVYEGGTGGLEIAAAAGRPRMYEKGRVANEPGTDNEQLELLGDSVVGLLVTELLLCEFPDRSEGELTRMRSTLVSRRRMALAGEELELGSDLRLGPTAEASGARHSTGMLANAMEALLAAMYLDAQRTGQDGLALTRGLVERLLVRPDLPSLRSAVAASHGRDALRDSKSTLQERAQAVSAGQLRYADVAETGPAHERRFTVQVELIREGATTVLATADGRSKKEAQQAAAARALASWRPA